MNGPIGIFDSGLGGLTVSDPITKQFPGLDMIYLGDNARTPYGPRSQEIIYRYTLQGVRRLFEMGCPLVILACNTASARALRQIQRNDLEKKWPGRRVLGVIRPSAELAAASNSYRTVAVAGTAATVGSSIYKDEINALNSSLKVIHEACPMWVPLVENNEIQTPAADYFVQRHMRSLFDRENNIDILILGCTHYPVLLPLIRKYVPQHVDIIDQGPVVAGSLVDYLRRHPEIDRRLSRNGQHKYYTSGSVTMFDKNAAVFSLHSIKSEHLEFDE